MKRKMPVYALDTMLSVFLLTGTAAASGLNAPAASGQSVPGNTALVSQHPEVSVYSVIEHSEGTGYEGDLARISVSIPERKEVENRINTSLKTQIYGQEQEILSFVMEAAQGGAVKYGPYAAEASVLSVTATDRVLSVLVYVSNYAGGPHPWGDYLSANYDLETGELLRLSDVFFYHDPWPPLKHFLYLAMASYPSATNLFLTDDLFGKASDLTDSLSQENPTSGWTLDESGLCFYYAGGTIGVYAGGNVELHVSADQLRSAAGKEEYLASTGKTLLTWTNAGENTGGENAQSQGSAGYDPSRHSYTMIYFDGTWQQACDAAQDQGGHLVTITSEKEQETVEALLAQYPGLRAVWTGARRDGQGAFYWITGEDFGFSFWGPGEPNNETGDENFMDLYPRDGRWVWNDVPMSISQYYAGSMGYILEKDL